MLRHWVTAPSSGSTVSASRRGDTRLTYTLLRIKIYIYTYIYIHIYIHIFIYRYVWAEVHKRAVTDGAARTRRLIGVRPSYMQIAVVRVRKLPLLVCIYIAVILLKNIVNNPERI